MADADADLLDEYTVSDLETLKLLGNPLRAQILQELVARAMSVKQIAAALDQPVTKLYRHVDLLLRAGVIRVVDQVVVSGIVESHYRAKARTYVMDRALFPVGHQEPALEAMLAFVLDRARVDILRAVRSGAIDLQAKAPAPHALLARRVQLRLSRKQARKLFERLLAMEVELADPDPEGDYYALTLVLHETAGPGEEPEPSASRRARYRRGPSRGPA